jgi:hypothetical protein
MNPAKIIEPFLRSAASAVAWVLVVAIFLLKFSTSDSSVDPDLDKISRAFGSLISDGWYYALLGAVVWTLLQPDGSKGKSDKSLLPEATSR